MTFPEKAWWGLGRVAFVLLLFWGSAATHASGQVPANKAPGGDAAVVTDNEAITVTDAPKINGADESPDQEAVSVHDTYTVTAGEFAPTIFLAFNPASITAGGSSTVTLTLVNSNATSLTGSSFTDILTNMAATGGAVGGSCSGASPSSLTSGATALSFSGITIPARGCTVTFRVTSTHAASNPNNTSGVTTTQTPAAGPVSNTASLTVNAVAQTITFGLLSDRSLGSGTFSLSATASSGLTVTFALYSKSVCTVSGETVTLIGVGICSIAANQAGNSTYLAAPTVIQSFTVSAAAEPAAAFLDQNGAPALTFNGSISFPDAGGFLIGAPGITQDLNGNVYVVGLDSAGGVHLNSYSYAKATWNGWQYSGGILDTTSGLTAAVAPDGIVWFTGRDVGNRYWINSWNGSSFGGWILVANGIFAPDSIPQLAIPSDGTIYVIGKDTGGRIWSNNYNPANQSFTGWVDRQSVMIGQPSAAAGGDGKVYVAVRGVSTNSPVYITQIPAQNAATANAWLNGGGQIDTDPQIASQGGTVYLLAEASGNAVYLLTFAESNQTYGSWSFTNGTLNDSTIAAYGGNVYIAGRDSQARIYWYSVAGTTWFLAGGAGISSTVLAGGK